MSQENVDFVTALYAGATQMNKDELLTALPEMIRAGCDPEVEWIEDPHRADGRTYHGHDGVLESFQRWLEGFDKYDFEVEEIRDCGEHVFVAAREQARGKSSGASVEARVYQVMTFRDGKLLRYREFYDGAMALEAAGVDAQP